MHKNFKNTMATMTELTKKRRCKSLSVSLTLNGTMALQATGSANGIIITTYSDASFADYILNSSPSSGSKHLSHGLSTHLSSQTEEAPMYLCTELQRSICCKVAGPPKMPPVASPAEEHLAARQWLSTSSENVSLQFERVRNEEYQGGCNIGIGEHFNCFRPAVPFIAAQAEPIAVHATVRPDRYCQYAGAPGWNGGSATDAELAKLYEVHVCRLLAVEAQIRSRQLAAASHGSQTVSE